MLHAQALFYSKESFLPSIPQTKNDVIEHGSKNKQTMYVEHFTL